MVHLSLNGAWRMKRTDESAWIDGKVPGSVYNDLLNAGKIEDPFFRDNEYKIREISGFDFEYEKNFIIDSDLLNCERIFLLCEGLDTISEVRINGHLAGATENMHRTYEFDIKNLLYKGHNTINVTFRSPIRYIAEKQKQIPLWGANDAMSGFPHIRKAHCMFGWDWGPQLPDMGIWRSISIRGYNTGRLDDVYITQNHINGRVSLNVRVRCSKWGTRDLTVGVAITAPDGSKIARDVACTGCECNYVIDIERPQLWWPNGYGGQPLYRVGISLKDGDVILDEREMNIGLRTIKVLRQKDQWGESFEFNVNGVSIFAKGANYIPEDSIVARCTPERTERLIRNCVEANFNTIRVWGGGIYPWDYFYDLCDKYGLIVWQDLMFACAVYNMTDEFADNIKREAYDNIKRIRHHACMGLWCGNNEIEMGLDMGWGGIKTEVFGESYKKQFEVLLRKVAEETDPESFYWPSSPSSGGGFDSPNDENRGDVHYWDVWHGLKPFTEYRKFFFRFVSEFGFQSFPSIKTVESFTLPEDRNIFSYVMESHQKNGTANGRILYYLSEFFKYPKNFESLLYASQLLQAEAIRYGVEHWRRNRGRCMGAIYWQLNDCWPVASWASIDYYGRWKALHYFAKRFFAPVLLSVLDKDKKAYFYVTNDTLDKVKGTVVWALKNNKSETIVSGRKEFDTDPLSAVIIDEKDFSDAIKDAKAAMEIYLEYSLLVNGNRISAGTLLFAKPKHFKFLEPGLKAEVEEKEDMFVLTVSSKAYAKYVELDVDGYDCVFSDNYFDVSAGDEKAVELKKKDLPCALTAKTLKENLRVRSAYDMA